MPVLQTGDAHMMDKGVKDFLKESEEFINDVSYPKEDNMQLWQFDGLAPPPPSVSVTQDMNAYVYARQREYSMVTALLDDALQQFGVRTVYEGRGRPPASLRDKLFLCIEKVHRAASYDGHYENIEYFHLKKYIASRPNPHSVGKFMLDPQLTPHLDRLVTFTSTPLAQLEQEFAVDSTGLGTYGKRWVKLKLDEEAHRRDFRKLHLMIGARTGIITAAIVTPGYTADGPQFTKLLEKTKKYFTITEISGDGSYTSHQNAQAVADAGGTPYFRIGVKIKHETPRGYWAWKDMLRRQRRNPLLYDHHYHKRSNVESTNSSFKRAIAEHLTSHDVVAQDNEALCLAIVHNLRVVARSVYCLGIKPKFSK
jgi:hypothetical protein